ncbi:hypothetical protein C8A03DRAFT_37411 [Achaetomium macrosporum]|uniref:Uncharacterized protein n=1 Tax=Achaetomium macrosporum TaxID=79813 RepID=A0AAN7HBE1_9PEZI|nr:hypothetical protein C8A03DRAFT_37411 [Achaetomium macrosporum]
MCRLCPGGGIPLPNCLDRRSSSGPSPSRAPRAPRPGRTAATGATISTNVASLPTSVRSARSGTPTARPATPTARPATSTPGPSGTRAGAALAREASRASGSSSSSDASAVSTATDESVKSLNTLANIISRDLHDLTVLADELRAWAKIIDPTFYAERQIEKLADWPREVRNAYDAYKAAGTRHAAAQAAYNDYMAANRRSTDPEVFLKRADLAIKWSKEACR